MDVAQKHLTRTDDGVQPGSRLDYALRYARAGFKVLPLYHIVDGACSCGDVECRSPGKHPLVVKQANMFGGVHSASDDAAVLRQVFTAHPQANIGLAIPDGMIAVDVDPRNGGDDTIDLVQDKYGRLPDTAMQLTGGGGQHYLYRIPAGVTVAGKLGAGVDVKAAGGYIVAEPSEHLSGTSYCWEASSDPLDGAAVVDAPAWLMNRLAANEAGAARVDGGLRYGVDERVVEELRSALAHLNATRREMADDRDMWVRVGMACKSIGDAGYQIWEEWSIASSKFDAADQWNKWQSFRPSAISYRTIFMLAQGEGWRNPLANKSVSGDANSAETRVNTGDEPGQRLAGFRFDDVAELVTDIKPIQWLIRDYVEQDSLVLVYGPPGSAKSFATVDFAACVATGQDWQGHAVKTGPVFYLAGEGHNGLARRFRAWEVARGVKIPTGMLWKSAGAAQILQSESIEGVAEAIWTISGEGKNPPALIVLDTLARNFGPGDENSTADMSNFIAAVDKYLIQPWRCAVVIVHHSGHGQDRARGSSALKAAVDAEHEVTRDEAGNVQLRTTKMKDAEIPAEKLLRLKGVDLPDVFDEDGVIASSAVLEPCEDGTAAIVVGTTKEKQAISVRDVLALLARGWMPYSEIEHSLRCGRSVAQNAVKKCAGMGLLGQGVGGGYAVTEKGMQVLSHTGALLTGASNPALERRSARPWMDTDKDDE